MRLTLLYQVGIANVFEHEVGKETPRRIMQYDYRSCEQFCRGAKHGGATITVMHFDHAGDVAQHVSKWIDGPGDLWSDKKHCADLRPSNPPASDSETEEIE